MSFTGSYRDFHARRVVTGVDAAGRSTVTSDGPTPVRLATPGNVKCDTWRFDVVPTTAAVGDGMESGLVITNPPRHGLVHRVVSVPPDDEWDPALGYMDSQGQLTGSASSEDSGGIAGMHWTPTVDIITVVSGELVCILDTGEVTLGPGDSLVQRGTKHTWRNRRSDAAVIVSVMVAAS